MTGMYIVTGCTLFTLFLIFLVISKTLNAILDQLVRLEYVLQKECEFKTEEKEVQRLLDVKKNNGDDDDS